MATPCTYCGADVQQHDPVFVEDGADGNRSPAGQFCNYACLARYIDDAGLEQGACCRIDID